MKFTSEREKLKKQMIQLMKVGNSSDLINMIKYFPDIFNEIQEDERIKNIEKIVKEHTKRDPILEEKLNYLFFSTVSSSEYNKLYKELYKEYPELMNTIFAEENKRKKEEEKEELLREKRRKEIEEEEKKWVALDGKNKKGKKSKNGKKDRKKSKKGKKDGKKSKNGNKKSFKH